ncbi:MAG: hypothetical protein IPK20_23155 [Betaproteobacteria bacterium]|nr:hypothetical protein [Betaproteobacteria bacterium]
MKLLNTMLVALGLVCAHAQAADLDALNLLNQTQFRALSEDLGAALSYKPLTPAEPLGITGFDIGIAVTATRLKNVDVFDRATSSGDIPSYLPVPTIRVHKGLPLDFDVGVMGGMVPGTNIRFYGGELRYAIVSGNVALPAVAVRGSYTRLNGVDQVDLDTKGLDLSISKGLLNFTPYGGIGRVWVKSTPNGVAGLAEESFGLNKVFAGLNFNVLLMNLAFEVDRTGEATSFGLKAGLRF